MAFVVWEVDFGMKRWRLAIHGSTTGLCRTDSLCRPGVRTAARYAGAVLLQFLLAIWIFYYVIYIALHNLGRRI